MYGIHVRLRFACNLAEIWRARGTYRGLAGKNKVARRDDEVEHRPDALSVTILRNKRRRWLGAAGATIDVEIPHRAHERRADARVEMNFTAASLRPILQLIAITTNSTSNFGEPFLGSLNGAGRFSLV